MTTASRRRILGAYPGSHAGYGERSGGARRQPRCQMAARSSLLRRAFRHASSVVAALPALAPRLVRLARHGYPAWLLGAAIALLVAIVGGCGGGHEVGRRGPRLVILGFDGVDPRLLSRWMEEGKLPLLRAVAERGDFRRLPSTNPPQSPVACATFATGTEPGRHGIFDFI